MLHFGIGILLAVCISFMYNYTTTTTSSVLEKTNIILLLILILPMIVYKVLPKSDYMLNYTHQTDQDYKDWFSIYSE